MWRWQENLRNWGENPGDRDRSWSLSTANGEDMFSPPPTIIIAKRIVRLSAIAVLISCLAASVSAASPGDKKSSNKSKRTASQKTASKTKSVTKTNSRAKTATKPRPKADNKPTRTTRDKGARPDPRPKATFDRPKPRSEDDQRREKEIVEVLEGWKAYKRRTPYPRQKFDPGRELKFEKPTPQPHPRRKFEGDPGLELKFEKPTPQPHPRRKFEGEPPSELEYEAPAPLPHPRRRLTDPDPKYKRKPPGDDPPPKRRRHKPPRPDHHLHEVCTSCGVCCCDYYEEYYGGGYYYEEKSVGFYGGFQLGGGSLTDDTYDGFGVFTLQGSVIDTKERLRLDIGLSVMPLLTEASPGVPGLKDEGEVGFSLALRYHFTPPHRFLGIYGVGGIRSGWLFFDYENAIQVGKKRQTVMIESDDLVFHSLFLGVGVNLVQTRHMRIGSNLVFGWKFYGNTTSEGFDNDLFDDQGFVQLVADFTFGSW